MRNCLSSAEMGIPQKVVVFLSLAGYIVTLCQIVPYTYIKGTDANILAGDTRKICLAGGLTAMFYFLASYIVTLQKLIRIRRGRWKYIEYSFIKGIFQPFELGGETRLIRSAVKY